MYATAQQIISRNTSRLKPITSRNILNVSKAASLKYGKMTPRPMFQKYFEVWREHADRYGPQTALLYQVGGFFEIYDTENLTTGKTNANIRHIAELCQLSLTTHVIDGGDPTTYQTLFGGFPEHALAKFERILVQAGYTVVVVVQKMKAGKVEERIVDHIASPGCYVDAQRERFLVGIVLESLHTGVRSLQRTYWAATALDIATGRIWFIEGTDRDRLHQFLCVHPPAEIVIWSDGSSSIVDSLKSLCSAVHLCCLTPANAAVDEAELKKLWPAVGKQLPWIYSMPQARRCLAALMEFANDHMPSSLKALKSPETWIPDDEVRLGNAALEQLGLLSLRSEKQSLLGLMDQCRSVLGRRLMRARLLRPISNVTALQKRLDLVDAATTLLDNPTTERALRSLYDMTRLWRRVELGTASIGDMACLLRAYDSAAALSNIWKSAHGWSELNTTFLDWVSTHWSLTAVTELAQTGVTIPTTMLPWHSHFPTFDEGLALRQRAAALCAKWSTMGRGEALYLSDAEGGGFRITGTKRRITSLMADLPGATITPYKTTSMITTPALDALSAEHRAWMARWTVEWNTAWQSSLQELIQRGEEAHSAIASWCAEVDLAWTTARLSRDWLWKRPEFVEESEEAFVDVANLRHPILERLTTTPYVSHSITLSQQSSSGLLLYGMNASGKSSLMKSLGIAVVLAQAGFPVPATTFRLAPFKSLFTRILGNDNLWAGLSSFAVEMIEFREILQFADSRSLVLGDELCSGTESLSATALVAAGIETLTARRTKFIFATHLHELAALPDIAALTGVKPVHLKVHYDATTDQLVYERTLSDGPGSSLYGLEVCRALDLPTDYLDRAMALRKALEGWQKPTRSAYSATAVVDACAVCGSAKGLETHHIIPQAQRADAAVKGIDVDSAGNLVCLCASCHDDHHGGRLQIERWEETSSGRRLVFSTKASSDDLTPEIAAWVREQKRRRVRIAIIQRMGQQLYSVELPEKWIRGIRIV